MTRPRIAIFGRFAESTSVTRHAGLVIAERLAQAVWVAGGEPITMLPVPGADLAERLVGFSGVLMPGGGDVNPALYGQAATTPKIYGVVDAQDQTDVELFEYAIANELPLLAICRGFQIVNVARGGSLVQDMAHPHLHHIESIAIERPELFGTSSASVEASCYHHQCIDALGAGLEVLARSEGGNVEAFAIESKAWALGVQWHPEDNFGTVAENLAIFKKLVDEARG